MSGDQSVDASMGSGTAVAYGVGLTPIVPSPFEPFKPWDISPDAQPVPWNPYTPVPALSSDLLQAVEAVRQAHLAQKAAEKTLEEAKLDAARRISAAEATLAAAKAMHEAAIKNLGDIAGR